MLEALIIGKQKIEYTLYLWNLLGQNYTFEWVKDAVLFYSDGRVDFRELVKDLSRLIFTRIELWQIGVMRWSRGDRRNWSMRPQLCCSIVPRAILSPVSDQNGQRSAWALFGIRRKFPGCVVVPWCAVWRYENGWIWTSKTRITDAAKKRWDLRWKGKSSRSGFIAAHYQSPFGTIDKRP